MDALGAGADPAGVEPSIAAAADHAAMGSVLPPEARLRLLKRAILRLNRGTTSEQVAFNGHIVDALRAVDRELELSRSAAHADRDAIGKALGGVEAAVRGVAELAARLDEQEAAVTELRESLKRVEQQSTSDRTELLVQKSRFEVVSREARRRMPEPLDAEQLTTIASTLRDDFPDIYAALEERFRGSREVILERHSAYLDDIAELRGGYAPVLDIGSGRAEWLELLRDQGIPAYGVDLSPRFVEEAKERGLDLRLGDAVAHLETEVEPGSLGGVSAFHVAEHLKIDVLIRLVDAALRGLRPGGLLLVETPNPENLVVGAATFYLDPTHLRPLHPLFLEFLVSHRGFVNVEVRRLHPTRQPFPTPEDGGSTTALIAVVTALNDLLAGGADYAVLARRAPEPPSAAG